MILEGLRNFGGGGLNTPNPPRYATVLYNTTEMSHLKGNGLMLQRAVPIVIGL